MKKKNILFQTAVVACLLFGTGINMSSCIEQTFPKSSTAISEQIAESPAAMNAMLNAVVGFVNAYNTYGQGYTWDLGYTSYGIIRISITRKRIRLPLPPNHCRRSRVR